jgi:hypothetical protein
VAVDGFELWRELERLSARVGELQARSVEP